MRTVAEVLDAMIEQSENAIAIDQRAVFASKLTRGQLLENSPRVAEALAIWEEVLRSSDGLVQDSREHLRAEVEQADAGGARPDSNRHGGSNDGDGDGNGDDDDDDDDDDDVDRVPTARVGEAQRRLRYALELQHKAVFFCANAHYQIKSNEDMTQPDSEDFKRLEQLETEGYERAKRIRREILQDSHSKASRLISAVSQMVSEQEFATIPEMRVAPGQGLESRRVLDTLEELAGALNEQADLLDEIRENTAQLLLKDLVDEDEDVDLTGNEYADSTRVQEDVIAFITVLRAVVADRQAALSGQKLSKLTQDEIRNAVGLAEQGDGPSPDLLLALVKKREEQRLGLLGSLRGVITDLRDLTTKLGYQASNGHGRARLELEVATAQLKDIQGQISQQTKIVQALEQEIDKFASTMNARVEYYRQLQAVSDQVAPREGPSDGDAMTQLQQQEETLAQKLATSEAKHRYLLHLKETDAKEEQRMCVICQSIFSTGVLTICGHAFCKECITLWYRAHRTCPMCKRQLKPENLHDITLKPQELRVVSESNTEGGQPDGQPRPGSKTKTIFAEFSAEKLAEIKDIDLPGPSFTTKVDTLVRHLLWLRESDPGTKSIVFSQ